MDFKLIKQTEEIYIGCWFQRTMLHLSEVYEFFKSGTSHLPLNIEKLQELKTALDIKDILFEPEGFEHIHYSTNSGINLKITEDGLIILNMPYYKKSWQIEQELIAQYYETKLSPALAYLFSLGAPVPKELANIKEVYPYFIVMDNASKSTMEKLSLKFDKQKYYYFSDKDFDYVRGDMYSIVNVKKKGAAEQAYTFISEQIFVCEFKRQLHHYLNLHRTIWGKISYIKERKNINGKQIIQFNKDLETYTKTINLVEARINQMGNYLKTREKLMLKDPDLKQFLSILEYRYETLGNTLSYIQQQWAMTKNYVSSTRSLFTRLETKITQQSLKNLTIFTIISVIVSLINALDNIGKIKFEVTNVLSLIGAVLIGYVTGLVINIFFRLKRYNIMDKDYEKFDVK